MKNNSLVIPIKKFLANYLEVDVDYSRKKWTHAKLYEILNEFDLTECVCDKHEQIWIEDIYRGHILYVIDQYGKCQYYKNPREIKRESVYQVGSLVMATSIEKMKEELQKLYKKRITELRLIQYHVEQINQLNEEIERREELLHLIKEEEALREKEKESYRQKQYKKGDKKNGKYKRK